jgi:sulfate adenylyltransferase subunit 2
VDDIITELQTTSVSERARRAMDHEAEDSFERLRVDGYL